MSINNYDCVIVANGAFPENSRVLDWLRKAPFLIACDGAVDTLLQAGFIPNAVVGDLDSLSDENRNRFADRLYHNPDQETNDLTKAAEFARDKGFRKVVILAATGLREDHTLGNISLLAHYQRMFDQVKMISDYGEFVAIHGTTQFQSFPGQQISIFSLSSHITISTAGLRYPINQRQLGLWWEGTLNESLGNSFTIVITGVGAVLVYFRY